MSPKTIIKSLIALLVASAFIFAGNALVISSVTIILKENSINNFLIGMVNASFFLGAISATFFTQKIIAKISYKNSFKLFSIIFSLCTLAHSLSENLFFWLCLRFLMGICYYGLLIITEAWINQKTKNSTRSRILSFYEGVFYFAFAFGILILYLDLNKISIFITSAVLIMLSFIPLELIKIKEPNTNSTYKISSPKISKLDPLAILTSFIAGMLINGFFSMSSLFMLLQGFDVQSLSYFMFFAMCGGFMAQFYMGALSDKLGRKFGILLCGNIGIFAVFCFILFMPELYIQYFLAFLLGTSIFCLYPLSLAQANDMLKDKNKIVDLGRTVLFCYSLGSLLAPLFLGILMQYFSFKGFLWFFLANLAFLTLFISSKTNVFSLKFTKQSW